MDVAVSLQNEYALEPVIESVKAQFAALGLTPQMFVSKRICIKPNLLLKRTPEEATTTHPVVVRAVVETLLSYGVKAQNMVIADSPGGLYTQSHLKGIYAASGLQQVSEQTGVALNMDTGYQTMQNPKGQVVKDFSIINPIAKADMVISVAKLKSHCMTGLSGGVKNLFGCVPGLLKPELHSRFPKPELFCRMLVDLCELVRPVVTVVDAIVAMEGDGPSGGSPKQTGMILSAANPYALDVVLAQIMHTDPMGILTIQNSAERGLVKMDEVQCIFPQGGRLLVYEDFKLPKSKGVDFTGSVPKFLKRPVGYLFGSLLSPRPVVQREKCIGCGKCKESCPQHTIAIQNHKAYIHKNNCIRCYCCHEMCPVRAISIKRSRLFDM